MNMNTRKGLPPHAQVRVTSLQEQRRRQWISDDWEPKGFERFALQQAWLREMPVLGGINDQAISNPRRYEPATSCQETLDCHCGESR